GSRFRGPKTLVRKRKRLQPPAAALTLATLRNYLRRASRELERLPRRASRELERLPRRASRELERLPRMASRELERTAPVETAGVLATIAFLVVLRLLINDFFWMVMARSLSFDFDFFD